MFLLRRRKELREQTEKSKFTFQYVSIKTDNKVAGIYLSNNLHSNMFLLRLKIVYERQFG